MKTLSLCLVLGCIAAPAIAQTETAADLLRAGKAALASGDTAGAREKFQRAVALDRAASQRRPLADDLFYVALSFQQEADKAVDARPLLAEARKYYQEAIGARDSFPDASNNLAEVYFAENNEAAGLEALRAAASAPGSRRGFYAQRYAEKIAAQGKYDEACRFLVIACQAQPENDAARRKLIELCLARNRAALIDYLWTLRPVVPASAMRREAAELLAGEWADKDRTDLAMLIALSLSAESYAPDAFSKSDAAVSLEKVKGQPAIRELIALHRLPLAAAEFPWWRKSMNYEDRPPPRGWWPQEAFRQLARSLAARWNVRGNRSNAESYYEFAAFLDERAPDLEALTRLAEIYGEAQNRDQLGRLAKLMQAHEEALFSAKAVVIHNQQWDRAYQFHSALGAVYSALGQWGDANTPNSAVFQLEHARSAARRITLPAGDAPLASSPPLVNMLADAYVKTNRADAAYELRLAEGQRLLNTNPAAAGVIFRALEAAPAPANPTPAQRDTFNLLKQRVPMANRRASVDTPVPPVTTQLAEQPAVVPVTPRKSPAAGAGAAYLKNAVPLAKRTPTLDFSKTAGLTAAEKAKLDEFVKKIVESDLPVDAGTQRVLHLPADASALGVKNVILQKDSGKVMLEGKAMEVPFSLAPAVPR